MLSWWSSSGQKQTTVGIWIKLLIKHYFYISYFSCLTYCTYALIGQMEFVCLLFSFTLLVFARGYYVKAIYYKSKVYYFCKNKFRNHSKLFHVDVVKFCNTSCMGWYWKLFSLFGLINCLHRIEGEFVVQYRLKVPSGKREAARALTIPACQCLKHSSHVGRLEAERLSHTCFYCF